MISIGKMGGGQERYYLEKVAEGAEDYYSGEGEAEGYWLGDAAHDLGLQGKVEPDQLTGTGICCLAAMTTCERGWTPI
jgi:hypothetical protein